MAYPLFRWETPLSTYHKSAIGQLALSLPGDQLEKLTMMGVERDEREKK